MAKYDLSFTTTDLEDRALVAEVKATANPDVQTLLENRLRETLGGFVASYLGRVGGAVTGKITEDSAKLEAVAAAAGVDLGKIGEAAVAVVADEVKP